MRQGSLCRIAQRLSLCPVRVHLVEQDMLLRTSRQHGVDFCKIVNFDLFEIGALCLQEARQHLHTWQGERCDSAGGSTGLCVEEKSMGTEMLALLEGRGTCRRELGAREVITRERGGSLASRRYMRGFARAVAGEADVVEIVVVSKVAVA